MSIVSSFSLADAARPGTGAGILLGLLTAVSLVIASVARVLPPRRANGLDRIPPGRSAWPLSALLFAAMGAYLFAGMIYTAIRFGGTSHNGSVSIENLPPGAMAFVSTVPPLVALLVLVFGNRILRPQIGQDLGLGLHRLPGGLLRGLLGALIVIPPLLLMSNLLELAYRAVHYQHPAEHPLLHLLGERPRPAIEGIIVVGACVIAPLFEETLFRGFLQTLIRRFLYWLSTPADSRAPGGGPADVRVIPPLPSATQTWIAIVITSTLFASVHPVWSQPIIFVLALCLGYAYERTGNLWVPITMHAAFNSLATALFLAGLAAH